MTGEGDIDIRDFEDIPPGELRKRASSVLTFLVRSAGHAMSAEETDKLSELAASMEREGPQSGPKEGRH